MTDPCALAIILIIQNDKAERRLVLVGTLFLAMQALVTYVLDYGLGLLTLSNSHLTKLAPIQNEIIGVVLGCTRDILVIAM